MLIPIGDDDFLLFKFSTRRSTPSLLKPNLFIKYFSFLFLKILGFGLPICGLGVTVPTSMKPTPKALMQSTYSAFLSNPAAMPRLFDKPFSI